VRWSRSPCAVRKNGWRLNITGQLGGRGSGRFHGLRNQIRWHPLGLGSGCGCFYGAPDPALNTTPRQVGTNHDWQACAPFWNRCTLLMKQDGSLWALDDVLDQRGKRIGNPAGKIQSVPLRNINLQKDIVAFCGGRHRLGVAVTRDGEVWTWGWALGQQGPATAIVQALSQFLNRAGVRNKWGQGRPDPVIHPEPWQLPNVPPPSTVRCQSMIR